MKPRKITDLVYWHGAIDWDRRLFDALTSQPDGTSYNPDLFDLKITHLGKDAIALVDAVTLGIGTPTAPFRPHSMTFHVSYTTNSNSPKLKFASIISSYGWNREPVEQNTTLIPNLKVELHPPVMCKGFP